jgi:hypothetical protein
MQTEVRDHPAKYSPPILRVIETILLAESLKCDHEITVFDCFGGTGLIHSLSMPGFIRTEAIEIEPEWAMAHPWTRVGNALHVDAPDEHYDVICTSPTYGNRMADHHEAKDDSKRLTYRHQLGRMPHEDSSAILPWGPKYWDFHKRVWVEQSRILRPGGLFILNAKDFYRTRKIKGTKVVELVEVVTWHMEALLALGFKVENTTPVPVRGMKMGANHKRRVPYEMVVEMRKRK